MAQLVEGFCSGHRVAFLNLVDIPERENQRKVHEQHTLLAKILQFDMGICRVSVENHLDDLNLILGMVANGTDHSLWLSLL